MNIPAIRDAARAMQAAQERQQKKFFPTQELGELARNTTLPADVLALCDRVDELERERIDLLAVTLAAEEYAAGRISGEDLIATVNEWKKESEAANDR